MAERENIGKFLVYQTSKIQVGLVVLVWNDKFIQRFWPTYNQYPAGIDHKLLLVRNQGSGSEALTRLLQEIGKDHEVVEVPNFSGKAWIEGYERLRKMYNYIFFTTDSVWINGDHWLLHAFLSLYSTGAGMAGHQYSNGNLRQDFWGAKTEVLDRLHWGTARSLKEWYELARSWEWGDLCFSRQCQNMGYSIVQIGSKGLETVVGGDYEYCLECLDEIPDLVWESERPNYRVIKFEIMKYLRDQKYDTVINALTHFPEDEFDVDLLAILAFAHFNRGHIPDALRLWQKAAVVSPNRKDIRRSLSTAEAASRQLAIDRSLWLEQQGNRGASLSLMQTMHARDPNDVEITAMILAQEEGMRTPSQFMSLLEKELPPAFIAEHLGIIERISGDLAFRNMEYENAHGHYVSCLQGHRKDHRALTGLALVELAMGEHIRSLEYLQEAKALCPYSPLLFHTLGTVFEKLNDYTNAMAAYHWCLSLMPDHGEAEARLRHLIPLEELKALQKINVDAVLQMKALN